MVRKLALAVISLFAVATAHANWDGGWNDVTGLCTVLEYGGGKDFFSSDQALRRALGNEGAKQEWDKLNGQFGENRVIRFKAVADYIIPATWRICNLHWGSKYTPAGGGWNSFAHYGMDNGTYSSERGWRRFLQDDLHNSLVKSIDQRFGEGAAANFFTIMDQLHTDLKDKLD
jgi:hypothetical protein